MKQKKKTQPHNRWLNMGTGLALGFLLSIPLDNLSIGIALGIVFGVAFEEIRKKRQKS